MNDQPLDNNTVNTNNPTPQVDSAPYKQPAQPVVPDPLTPPATLADDLAAIKQKALAELTPMVNTLDQSPEDRFRTIMMMIQASDNEGLIKDAYAAAEKITNDKHRAQALLDVVNEINYFTQRANQ